MLLVVLLVPFGATAHCFLHLGVLAGVSLFSFHFVHLFWFHFSLGFLSPLGLGGVGGNTVGRGLSQVGSGSQCCGGSPLIPGFSFITLGHWVVRMPRNGSSGSLLELLLYRSLRSLVLALSTVHSVQ